MRYSDIVYIEIEVVMMKGVLLLTLAYLLGGEAAVLRSEDMPVVNDNPIIGILSQENSVIYTGFPEDSYTSYIAASYVKSVEAAGARVVPIMIGQPRTYYEDLMKKINGVLFPGGGASFSATNGYVAAAKHIYEIAMKMNDEGDYFPIWGTCLGFQLLVTLASGRQNRDLCLAYNVNLPLDFIDDYRKSKMFREVPDDIADLLANKDLTVNAHFFCIFDKNLKAYNLTEDWKATSYSTDILGSRFIASIENNRYPFYGIQFHPEKTTYEWKKLISRFDAHSLEAIKANRHFMDFFVKEARKSFHTFSNEAEENDFLIYNYQPSFTWKKGAPFQQCYLF